MNMKRKKTNKDIKNDEKANGINEFLCRYFYLQIDGLKFIFNSEEKKTNKRIKKLFTFIQKSNVL